MNLKYTAVNGDNEVVVSFNVEVNAKKTLAEFIKHENHHGLSKDQLEDAYSLIKAAVKGDKKEQATSEPIPAIVDVTKNDEPVDVLNKK